MKRLIKKAMNYWSAPRHIAVYVVTASAAMLIAAYISQYGFGLDPCILCYYQRIPYFVNIVLGAIAFILVSKNEKAAKALLLLCALVFFADTSIAAFHVGVENGWWKGLEACGNAAMPMNASIEEMRAFINSRSIVRCDVPAFSLFGISMAGYNLLLSLGFAMDVVLLLWWNKRSSFKFS